MSVFDSIIKAKGSGLYANHKGGSLGPLGSLAVTAPKNEFLAALLRVPVNYVLEIYQDNRLHRAIALPITPQGIRINRPSPTAVTYTLGYLPIIEHTYNRRMTIEMTGRSGLAPRQGHNREGAVVFRSGPELLREFDAFLDYYQGTATERNQGMISPLRSSKSRDVYMVFRAFDECLHLRVEPLSWDISREANSTRLSYIWNLSLQAYGPARPEKPPRMFGVVSDFFEAVTEIIKVGNDFLSLAPLAINNVAGAINDLRGPLIELGKTMSLFASTGQATNNVARIPARFGRDVERLCREILRGAEAFEDSGEILENSTSALGRNLARVFGSVENLRRETATAAGKQGVSVAEQPGSDKSTIAAGLTTGSSDKTVSGVTYPVRENDNLENISYRFFGDTSSWIEIAEANGMLDAHTWGNGKPLAVGDSLIIPGVSALTAALPMAPTASLDDTFGRDFLVDTRTRDLVLSPSSTDIRAVYGPENLAQAIRHRLLSTKGDVPYYPAYGIAAVPGSGATLALLGYVASHINEQLLRDVRIGEITDIEVFDEGDTLNVSAELTAVMGANISVVTPLSAV